MQDDNLKEVVQKRAHEIWERSGCPEGQHVEHWLQAETELRADAPATLAQNSASEMKKSAGARKKQRPKRSG